MARTSLAHVTEAPAHARAQRIAKLMQEPRVVVAVHDSSNGELLHYAPCGLAVLAEVVAAQAREAIPLVYSVVAGFDGAGEQSEAVVEFARGILNAQPKGGV